MVTSKVNRRIQTKHKCSGYFREQIAGCVTTAAKAGSSSRTLCSYLSNLPCCRETETRTCQNEADVKSSSSGETWIPLQITEKWERTEAIHVVTINTMLCSYLSNLPRCRETESRTCQNEAAVKSSPSGETWISLQITAETNDHTTQNLVILWTCELVN